MGLAGLVDFGKVANISYGLRGSGEVGAIGSQVGKDGCYGLVSNSRDGEEIFSWEGILGFLGREDLLNLPLQLFNRGGEGFDMCEEDTERSGSGLFSSARVDGSLGGLDELSDLFDVEVISFDGADDLFDLFRLGMGEVFSRRKSLENGRGGYGEGVFESGLPMFWKDDGEKREDLALVVFSFLDQFVAQFGEFLEGLDEFFSDLALDIFTGSQELGNYEGIDIIGLCLFGQGFPELAGVVGVEENDGETILLEMGVEVLPETS